MNLEKIVSILVSLLEDQENVKISYKIVASDDPDSGGSEAEIKTA